MSTMEKFKKYPPREMSWAELDAEMFAIIEAGTEESSKRFEMLQREHDRRDRDVK